MKKKKILALGSLVLCLILLLVVYLGLKQKEKTDEVTDSNDDKTVVSYILDWDEKKTHKISLFAKNGEKITFLKENDAWKMEEYEKISLIEDEVVAMIGHASGIEAVRTIENVENLAEYGLDNPLNVVEMETEDGKTESFSIGIRNDATGCTYIYLNDEKDVVYAVTKNMANFFKYDRLDFIVRETYPTFVNDNVQTVEVIKADSSFKLIYDFSATTCWRVEDPVYGMKLADEYEGDNLSSMLPLLSFAQFYEFDCQDFSEYGLDNPQMVVRVMYHETVQDENQESKTVERNLVLSVGDYDEAGYYYVRMNDSKEVHGIAETYINKLLNETVVDYWALNMSEVSLNDLSYVEVEYDGTHYVLKKEVKENTTMYSMNGTEVDKDVFETFYRAAIGVECQERKVELAVTEDAELTLHFYSVNGDKVTVSYIPWDENFYAVINNETDFGLVNKMKIKDLITLFLDVVE